MFDKAPLESLREEIARVTFEREFSIASRKSRTFVVVVSPWLRSAREWFDRLSPLGDADAGHFYPWIVLDADLGSFAESARWAFKSAYDVDRIQTELGRSSLLQETNQVIVVADLSEENASSRIESAIGAIRLLAEDKSRPEAPIYWTGVFITQHCIPGSTASVERAPTQEVGQTAASGTARSIPKQSIAGVPDDLFDRLFVIDVTNPKGAEIVQEYDQLCLVGHLLSFLATFPIAPDSAMFIEWLGRNDAAHGLLTGFSAFSYVLPVNQIIETIAVSEGSAVMRDGALAEEDAGRFRYYLRHFEQKNALATLDELGGAMVSDAEYPLHDPTDSLAAFEFWNASRYIAAMDAADASLPERAVESGKTLRKIGARKVREWNESLEDHLESMIAREKGGLPMARKFLDVLLDHIEKMMPTEPQPPEYEDPGIRIRRFESFIARMPRTEAVFMRAAILAFAAELALPYSLAGPLWGLILRFATPILIILLGVAAVYLRNHEATQHAIRVEKAIRDKYVALLDFATRKEIREALGNLREIVCRNIADIDTAIGRLNTIADHFENRYKANLPAESAFWKYIVRDRTEFLDFQRHCRFDRAKAAQEYLERFHPLRLWRRLTGVKPQEPDAWEWSCVEQAAEILIPGCGGIADLDIRDFFRSGECGYAALQSTVVNAMQPFVVIDPLMPSRGAVQNYVMIEADEAGQRTMLEPFLEELSQHVSIQRIGSRSQYRCSFYGFCEGMKLIDIAFR